MLFCLKSASEVFQKQNETVFQGIEGIHIVADNIIIVGSTVEEHDKILQRVLDRAIERNVKFNFDRFQLRVDEVKYLRTIISDQGMKPDPSKVQTIAQMPTQHDKLAVHCLLGMINFLGPHIPNFAAVSAPLRELIKADVHFEWSFEAEKAWKDIKPS